jgi:peptide/nickel transport system substrate-binding protein
MPNKASFRFALTAAGMMMVVASIVLVPAPAAMGQDSLGFGDQVSVQVTRGNNSTQNSTSPTEGPAQPAPSGCLIATAAFGSELTPQVQFLRGFRDNHILSTAAGTSFMSVFNNWYYSFSPSVADYERQNPWAQQAIKTAIYPLLGILHVAEGGYGLAEGETGAAVAGFAASSLIGAVYLAPVAVGLRKKVAMKKLAIILGVAIAASASLMGVGVLAGNSILLMASTAAFVLSSMGVGVAACMMLVRSVSNRLIKK